MSRWSDANALEGARTLIGTLLIALLPASAAAQGGHHAM
jgi:hypothetical protein